MKTGIVIRVTVLFAALGPILGLTSFHRAVFAGADILVSSVLPPEIEEEIFELKLGASRYPQRASRYRHRIARLYREAGFPQRAIFEYRMDAILAPERASVSHRRIAEIYEEMGETELAAREFELSRAARPPTQREERRRRLRQWEEDERFEDLLQEYRYLLHTSPDSARAGYLERIAELLQRMGREEQALDYYRELTEFYQRLAEENPDRESRYRFRISRVYQRAGLTEESLRELSDLTEEGGEDGVRAGLELASRLRREGDLEGALAAARAAAEEESPMRWTAYERIAEILDRLGREEQARAARTRAVDLLAADETVYENERLLRRLARLKERAGREEEARGLYERLAGLYHDRLSDQPASAHLLHRRLADLYLRMERYRRAEEHYLEVLRLEPRSAAAHLFLSRLYRDHLGDEEAAETYYRRYQALVAPTPAAP